MNEYQKEQLNALTQINNRLIQMAPEDLSRLLELMSPYVQFRQKVDRFLNLHFAEHCSQSCFQKSLSACCSKDGIITFWADVVVNACQSTALQVDRVLRVIESPNKHDKCIYLGPEGCCWQIRPLICAMFLCDAVKKAVLIPKPDAANQWDRLTAQSKTFRWPDQPVLFDHIEQLFMAAGCRSPLMYLNTSPGLLRIKQQAGLLGFKQ